MKFSLVNRHYMNSFPAVIPNIPWHLLDIRFGVEVDYLQGRNFHISPMRHLIKLIEQTKNVPQIFTYSIRKCKIIIGVWTGIAMLLIVCVHFRLHSHNLFTTTHTRILYF